MISIRLNFRRCCDDNWLRMNLLRTWFGGLPLISKVIVGGIGVCFLIGGDIILAVVIYLIVVSSDVSRQPGASEFYASLFFATILLIIVLLGMYLGSYSGLFSRFEQWMVE